HAACSSHVPSVFSRPSPRPADPAPQTVAPTTQTWALSFLRRGRRAKRHALAYPAGSHHRAIGFAAGHETVIAVQFRHPIVEQTPDRIGAGRTRAFVGNQRLESDALVVPAVILFLQQRALVSIAGIEVGIDQRRIETA